MKYCIGEFSTILGITRDTLRLYEKHQIVEPAKDNHNSYRYYNDLDARNLLMSRWYRSMGIPLPEVAELMKHASVERVNHEIASSREQLEEEIRRKTMLLDKMNQIEQEIGALDAELFQCRIKQRPGWYRLKQTVNNRLLKNERMNRLVNQWMDCLPFAFFSFRIEQEELLTDSLKNWKHSWGLTLTEEDVQKLGIEIGDQVEYIPPTQCLSAVIVKSQSSPITKETLGFMFEELTSLGYQVTGDIVGRIIMNEQERGKKRSYLEVNISI